MWAFTQSNCFLARKLTSACKALVLGRLFICSIPERHFTKCTLLVTIYPLFNLWVEIDLKLFEYLTFLWRGSDYFKSNLFIRSLYYAEACYEFAGPISASLLPGNTATIEEMSQRRRAVGKTVSKLTETSFGPQTFRSSDERVTARPTGRWK